MRLGDTLFWQNLQAKLQPAVPKENMLPHLNPLAVSFWLWLAVLATPSELGTSNSSIAYRHCSILNVWRGDASQMLYL